MVYALQKTIYFVLGCKQLIMATDHRPLLCIFDDRDLEIVDNPRLRKLKEKSLVLRFTITHVPDYPFQHICCDYFSFSNWFNIFEGKGRATCMVDMMTWLFQDFRLPQTLTSDGSIQLTSYKF